MSDVERNQTTSETSKMEEFFGQQDVTTYSRGDILMGKIVQLGDEQVLVDIGYKSEAIMKVSDLAPYHRSQPVKPGDQVEVLVTYIDEEEGTVYVSEKAAIYEKKIGELERAYKHRTPVTGTVEDEVRDAGYHVNLKGIRAFLPGSHLGTDLPAEINELRGKEILFVILELDRREHNLVVSHRDYMRDQDRKRKDELFAKLQPGEVREGTIKSVVDFGIFVDLGGFEGLVHRSEISWKEVPVPPNTYKLGDKLQVKILGIDRNKDRISLSLKQLRPNPWEGLATRYPKGQKFTGEVVSLTDFGAFVRLEDDVEGLVHISELSWGFPTHPKEIVHVGQKVEVVVLDVNETDRRVSLSMRRAQPDPWEKIEEKYPEGKLVKGKVTKLVEFGAFIELEPGVEALLHVSEISWEHVARPGDVLKENQEIEAKVIKSDGVKRKIRLSLKELKQDPWHTFTENFSLGSVIEGKITEIKDFGAFIKLTDEVEGLIHVSEITDQRIATPADVLKVGDTVTAKIIGINEEKRQVRLSMRHRPEEPEAPARSSTAKEPEDSGHQAVTMGERLKAMREQLKDKFQ
ncbi:30S ribosomal protein S1 [Candidatus Acetothermia bacterium]|nr:30S ribosomal protein S1 [Candidatus Acetothermia bacterium]MBI3460697.1 30S ribosomal protein S1 [Candidatus Acetothermia bacterium]